MLTGAGVTVMLRALVTETEFASTTFTVKFAVPAAEGVPVICAADKTNPAGRVPDEIDHA
jgi:hypothetical protein